MRIVWLLFRGVKTKYRATRMYLGKLHRATLFFLALVLGPAWHDVGRGRLRVVAALAKVIAKKVRMK